MNPLDLERTACTVENFLNALRLPDGATRTQIESALVQWLAADPRAKQRYVIYQHGKIDCFTRQPNGLPLPPVVRSFAVPADVQETRVLWCDSRKLSVLNPIEWTKKGLPLFLGTAGLLLTLPGIPPSFADMPPQRKEGGGEVSYSNNNNNNNNNG